MTVEQLIEELEKQSPGARVAAGTDDTAEYYVRTVRERGGVVIIDATDSEEV